MNLRPSQFARSPKGEEIHVWRVSSASDSSARKSLEVLSPDERARAERYHFVKDRNRFIVARTALRKILGGYLNMSPSRICLSYNQFGKPYLNMTDAQLRFNVSHSNGVALIAVAHMQEVGVDIEFVDNNFEILKTARNVFSPTDYSALEALPSNLQPAAFFRGFTRLEARLKALGRGFSSTLTALEKKKYNGTMLSFNSGSDYACALVAERKVERVCYREWPNR